MYRTLTCKLNLSTAQNSYFEGLLSHTRFLYNSFLAQKQEAYKSEKKSTSLFDDQKHLSSLKKTTPELAQYPDRAQKGVLTRLDNAFKGFFRRIKQGKKAGYPRFKSADRWNTIEYVNLNTKVIDCSIKIPKFGKVTNRRFGQITGPICTLRVLRRSTGWFLQVVYNSGPNPEPLPIQTSVGIDVGLTSFAVLSNGEQIENPRFARKFERKIRRANRVLARKKRGSNRRARQKKCLAKLHEKVVGARKDFIHQLSRKLVDRFDLICCEKLNIRGMVRGKLSKSILDASWGFLYWCLSYKAASAGKTFIQIDPRGTSQVCSKCGATVPKKLSERTHVCPECGFATSRDHNSALEILRRGLTHYGQVGPEIKHAELALLGSA